MPQISTAGSNPSQPKSEHDSAYNSNDVGQSPKNCNENGGDHVNLEQAGNDE